MFNVNFRNIRLKQRLPQKQISGAPQCSQQVYSKIHRKIDQGIVRHMRYLLFDEMSLA